MSKQSPLTGAVLVSCAKANATQGLEQAAQQCGYGTDTTQFTKALKAACDEMGVGIDDLNDLITEQQQAKQAGGIEVAPDTPSQL